MSPQTANLIIPLFSLLTSVLVVLISSASTVWAKRVDVKQKKEDRDQELRKIYVARKIETGEAVIGRWTLLLQKLDWFNHHYSTYNFDNYISEEEYLQVMKQEEKINEIIQSSSYTDKNYYYLYFEREMVSQDVGPITEKHDLLRKKVVDILTERNEIVHDLGMGNPGGLHAAIEQAYRNKREEFNQTFSSYLEANKQLKELILESCAVLRKQMSKYDLA